MIVLEDEQRADGLCRHRAPVEELPQGGQDSLPTEDLTAQGTPPKDRLFNGTARLRHGPERFVRMKVAFRNGDGETARPQQAEGATPPKPSGPRELPSEPRRLHGHRGALVRNARKETRIGRSQPLLVPRVVVPPRRRHALGSLEEC